MQALETEPWIPGEKLSEKLVDVLKFVNDSNNEGDKPSYSDIRTKLGLSKYLEITEKGKTYMTFR